MPSIEIPWILTIINEKNLEQAGIIANFFAGLFLAVEYFVSAEKIDHLNDRLDYRTSKAFYRSTKAAKAIMKLNRKVLLVIVIAIIALSTYQVMFYHQSTLAEYFMYYYRIAKQLLGPIHKILAGVIAVAIITYILMFIAHRAPKKTVGALGLLLFIIGNILLFLHTLYI
ncbi:MAG: hypothetical protein ACE14P_12100 [Methanotrichaceae archaeon]